IYKINKEIYSSTERTINPNRRWQRIKIKQNKKQTLFPGRNHVKPSPALSGIRNGLNKGCSRPSGRSSKSIRMPDPLLPTLQRNVVETISVSILTSGL